ncbi:MAG TPA: DUF167 domain-containing protein [Fimbriimonadaceae bacterium]|nr:DUF167 domain-containing protein [Fimbriimonadaceae bacterium]
MARLSVRVTPRSSRNKVEWTDPVKVYVSAPPVDGEANDAVCAVVAKDLGLSRSKVRIVSGQTSRNKVLEIDDFDESELNARQIQPKLQPEP